MSATAGRRGGRAWPRVLALLLVLLLPGAHPAASLTAPALAVPGECFEHDVLDTALRPPRRAAAPLRPAPARHPAPGAPARRPLPAPPLPLPSYGPDAVRTVVLRC
ncbi:hypothetical protein [Streptomyces sp. NPDC093094]|uniref:hypothetical protein n=1 Tax=Streptomyces sp. NPDC093094 TaxID=3366026 RepID=UPI003821AE67